MNTALILASSTVTYTGLALVAKYLIDHDDPREALRHDAAAVFALAMAVAHFRSSR